MKAPVVIPVLEPGTVSEDGLYYRSPHGEYYRDMKDLLRRADREYIGPREDVCYKCDLRGRLCAGVLKCTTGGNVGRWRQVKTLANGVLFIPPFEGGCTPGV